MDHLVIPLDGDHIHALAALTHGIVTGCGLAMTADRTDPHVTLVAYTGLSPEVAHSSIDAVAARTAPFVLHAHGYGFFTGDEPTELSLHVQVVRTRALDTLHRGLRAALHRAGADIAGWSEPDLWSPHITLLDRGLDPVSLGTAARWLAHRRHPSWRMPVDRVVVVGGRRDRSRPRAVVRFGARAASARAGPDDALQELPIGPRSQKGVHQDDATGEDVRRRGQ